MSSVSIYINNGKVPTVVQPASSPWRPRKAEYPWQVEQYTKPHEPRQPPIEKYTPPRPKKRSQWPMSLSEE